VNAQTCCRRVPPHRLRGPRWLARRRTGWDENVIG